MKFRTEISITDAPGNLSPERLVVLAGSCFSDNIGAKMKEAGWPAIVNPCGVIYNPVSMGILFQLALTHRPLRREIISSSLTEREGKFATWLMGAKALGETADECIDRTCETLDELERGIETAQALILTFGTSDVWLLAGSDRAVGNCHKHPAAEFEKKRADIGETVSVWQQLITAIRNRNPDIKIILTVSPRRYLSDGFAENSRQKAVLILACEQLCHTCRDTYYFPAYEILNDDLRDYRFYKPDLLHPSETAIDYVWEKFKVAFLDKKNLELLNKMEKEGKRRRHIQKS